MKGKEMQGAQGQEDMRADDRLRDITDAVVKSCWQEERDTLGPHPLPDREVVVEAVQTLRGLLFPRCLGRERGCHQEMEAGIARRIRQVQRALEEQIELSFHCISKPDNALTPREISYRFLSALPQLRELLKTDVEAAFEGDPAAQSRDEIIFAYPGVLAVSVYRMAHELHRMGTPLIPRVMTEYAHSITGIDIHPGATIGRYFFIDHGTGVVIGETTHIGDRVKLYQGVTLGALSTRGGQDLRGIRRHPTLEDEVTVYSNASILGGDTVIGKGAVIGGSAFITSSVAAGTRVSMKAPELVLKGRRPREYVPDWVI